MMKKAILTVIILAVLADPAYSQVGAVLDRAVDINTNTVNFGRVLSASETTVQAALDAIDDAPRIVVHATDCTTETGGNEGDICIEEDVPAIYYCNPSVGQCDTSGEWDLISSGLTNEQVEDIVGAMFSGNTETLVTVTYQDTDGTIDVVVTNDLSLYDWTSVDATDLKVGSVTQAYDADLDTYAGITPSANVQSLLGAANYAAMRALLDVEAGTDYYSISAADAAFQPLDADLTDLADGSLTGTKVGFADSDSNFTATDVQSAIEELDDVNGSGPNAADGKVDWSQLANVPAGFADGVDHTASGGSGTNIDVEEGGSLVVNTGTANFDADQFNVTDDSGDALVQIADIYLLNTGDTLNGDLTVTATLTAGGIVTSGGNDAILSTSGSFDIGGTGQTNNEKLHMDFEGTANTVTVTSATGVTTVNFSGIALQESGSGVISAGEIDTFSELDALVADENLVNTNDSQTLTNKTISGSSNTITNINDDNVNFDDGDGNYTAITVGSALEELDDVNGSGPNASDAKVDWSQIGNMPAGFADGTDDDAGGGDVVDDTTPQLGGDLDVNGNAITATSGNNVTITATLAVNTDTFFVDATNGRVGIGRTNPAVKLDIDGPTLFRSAVYLVDGFGIYVDGGVDTRISGTDDEFDFISGDGTVVKIADGGLVGIGTTVPGALLDLEATDSALRVTRLSDPSSNISSPLNGMIAYDSTDDQLQAYIGGSWKDLAASGVGISTGDIDTSSEIRAIVTDESGTGALLFAGGAIGAATATTPSANDNDTSVATTAYVQTELTAYASDSATFTNKQFDADGTGNSLINIESADIKNGGIGDIDIADTADIKTGGFGITIDGGGSAITTGVKGYIEVPYDCTIQKVTMLADQSGSAVVDIWVDSFASYPPTDADSITASAVPTISAATKSQDATLTGWTAGITAGDIVGFNVDSASTIERLHVNLECEKD